MGYINNIQIGDNNYVIEPILYGVCSSSKNASTKEISIPNGIPQWTLINGLIFYIKFTYGNSLDTAQIIFPALNNKQYNNFPLGKIKENSVIPFLYTFNSVNNTDNLIRIDPLNIDNLESNAKNVIVAEGNSLIAYSGEPLTNLLTSVLNNTYKKIQSKLTFTPDAAKNNFVSEIVQDTSGVLTVTFSSLDTSGTWTGTAESATTADSATTAQYLASSHSILGNEFNGTQDITNNLKLTLDGTPLYGKIKIIKNNDATYTQFEFIQQHTIENQSYTETYVLDHSTDAGNMSYRFYTTNPSGPKMDLNGGLITGILPLSKGGTGVDGAEKFIENRVIYKNPSEEKLMSATKIYVNSSQLYVGYTTLDQNYNFKVDGQSQFNGNTYIKGQFQVGENDNSQQYSSKIYGDLNVSGDTTLKTLIVTNKATIEQLLVKTTTKLEGNVTVEKDPTADTQPITTLMGTLNAKSEVNIYGITSFKPSDSSIAGNIESTITGPSNTFINFYPTRNGGGSLGNVTNSWQDLFISNNINLTAVDNEYQQSNNLWYLSATYVATNNSKTANLNIHSKRNNVDGNAYITGIQVLNENETDKSGFIIAPRLTIGSNIGLDTNYGLYVSGRSMFSNPVGIGLNAPNNAPNNNGPHLAVKNAIQLINTESNWIFKVTNDATDSILTISDNDSTAEFKGWVNEQGFTLKNYLYINENLPASNAYNFLVKGISYFTDNNNDNHAVAIFDKHFKLINKINTNDNDIIHFNYATEGEINKPTYAGQIYPETDMNGYLGLTTKRWNSLNLFKSMKINGQISNENTPSYIEAIVDNNIQTLTLAYDKDTQLQANKSSLQLKTTTRHASITLEAESPLIKLNYDKHNSDTNTIITNDWTITNDNNIFIIYHELNLHKNEQDETVVCPEYTNLKAYRGLTNNIDINNKLYGIEINPRLTINEDLNTLMNPSYLSNQHEDFNLYVNGNSYFNGQLYPESDNDKNIGKKDLRWGCLYAVTEIIGAEDNNHIFINNNSLTIKDNTTIYAQLNINSNNSILTLGGNSYKGNIKLYNNNSNANHTTIITDCTSDNFFHIPQYSGDLYAVHTGSTAQVGATTTGNTTSGYITSIYINTNGRATPIKYPTNRLLYGVKGNDDQYTASKHYIANTVLGINHQPSADKEGDSQFTGNYSGATLAINGNTFARGNLYLLNIPDEQNGASYDRFISFRKVGSTVGEMRFTYPTSVDKTSIGRFTFKSYCSDYSQHATFFLPNKKSSESTAAEYYNIFTGLKTVTNRLLFTLTDTTTNPTTSMVEATTGNKGHYADDTHIAINYTSQPSTNFYVSGSARITGATTLSGNTTIGGTLTVSKATTLNSTATLNGATTINGALTVNNVATITDTLTLTKDVEVTMGNATKAPLVIGSATGQHIAINYKRIVSKSGSTATGILYLNRTNSVASPEGIGSSVEICNSNDVNYVHIYSTKDSSSYTTGALVVDGGAGITGAIVTKKDINAGSYMLAHAFEGSPIAYYAYVTGQPYVEMNFCSQAGISASGTTRYRTLSASDGKPDIQGGIRLYTNCRTFNSAGNATGFGTTLFRFYQYSRNDAGSGNYRAQSTGHFECYQLPSTTTNRTSDVYYNILTTKKLIELTQGGTNNTSFTSSRLIMSDGSKLLSAEKFLYAASSTTSTLALASNKIDIPAALVSSDDTVYYDNFYFRDSNNTSFAGIRGGHNPATGDADCVIFVNNYLTSNKAMDSSNSFLRLRKTRADVVNCYLSSDVFLEVANKGNPSLSDSAGSTGAARFTAGGISVKGNILAGGNIKGTQVFNAVWNDYAECRAANTEEPGYCVTETDDGIMVKTTQRLEAGCKITSDTYGTCMGETENAKTPIAVAGRVLAYPYRARQEYPLGAAVCSAPNGTVDIMTRDEIMMYPERIVGTVSEIPTYEIWHGGSKENPSDIKVNGRIWIYVR